MRWLDPGELRIGLGCMRLEADGAATIAAAADAGITVFDTARAYPGNEELLARALRDAGAAERARIVTKGGMARPDGAWVPDGRAKAIHAHCDASLTALDSLPIDTYLLHAPDPRVPWATSMRALARLVDEGLVRRVGIANVNRMQLDEALELAPVEVVQVALSVHDDRALRGGVVDRCDELGIALMAHSPLGGPKRAHRTPADEALGWLLGLSPVVVPIPGARRPETARDAARATPISRRRPAARAPKDGGAEVVLVMGIPGAGKTRVAARYTDHVRLNRDERGGSLRELAGELDETLAAGAMRVVLDNTYLTRASRHDVLEAAARHGAAVRCVWLDTPVEQAQVNMVERLLDRFGALPTPEELKAAAKLEQGLLAPTQQLRAVRELEPPAEDEGFAAIERVAFERVPRPGRRGVFVAADAAGSYEPEPALRGVPHLVFAWGEDDLTPLAAAIDATLVETATCPHGGGPPVCWCRPPLPGLALAFARRHGVDPARSMLVGTSAAHRRMGATLGAELRP